MQYLQFTYLDDPASAEPHDRFSGCTGSLNTQLLRDWISTFVCAHPNCLASRGKPRDSCWHWQQVKSSVGRQGASKSYATSGKDHKQVRSQLRWLASRQKDGKVMSLPSEPPTGRTLSTKSKAVGKPAALSHTRNVKQADPLGVTTAHQH